MHKLLVRESNPEKKTKKMMMSTSWEYGDYSPARYPCPEKKKEEKPPTKRRRAS